MSVSDLLNRAEAAAVLRVKPQTLAAWHTTKRYSLPLVKIGSKVFYRRCDLDAFIAARTVGGADAQ